jgi:hypothetical protein
MTKSQRYTCVFAGLLLFGVGFGVPRAAYAVTGCTNASLSGTYNAQISSANFMSIVNALNGNTAGGTNTGGSTGSACSTGTTANPGGGFFGPGTPTTAVPPGGTTGSAGTSSGTTTTSGGTTGAVSTPPGFGSNPLSLSGSVPDLSRFFFDGNGNIIGQSPSTAPGGVTVNVTAGSYSINNDCTAAIKLASGQNFNAIVVNGGDKVLFLQNDANSAGVVGSLSRSTSACLNSGFSGSFGFSFFGAEPVAATGTTGAAAAANFSAFSAIGTLQLNSDGTFSMKQWTFQNGKMQPATATGTYAIGTDCGLSLTFAKPQGGTTGAAGSTTFTAPVLFRGALVNPTSGTLVVQPDTLTTVTGQFIQQ